MKTPRRWRWVTRDKSSPYVTIWQNEETPTDHHGMWYDPCHPRNNICAREFLAATGIEIKNASIQKIEFTARRLPQRSKGANT
jgi:hypothetical protein